MNPRHQAVLLDIEGTTGALSHVRDVLFPYARTRIAPWMTAHHHTDQGQQILQAVRTDLGDPRLSPTDVITQLEKWADADTKAAPLKNLQGHIWAAGYAAGELTGHVYPDVPPALAAWRERGIARYIYSSGSEAAQRGWFAHTAHGDLTLLLDGHFDLNSAGPKHDAASYLSIARAIRTPPALVLFASDSGEELDAAATAGFQTLAVRRPDDSRPAPPAHRLLTSLTPLIRAGAQTGVPTHAEGSRP
ncbi:acireductone synthase [Streptomyces sp. NPDC050256]|uniref:acireductone synthase n=1 Tax=Streptomyces sp. NPDC050256 TaxID=3365607 RepID=UPI0037A6E173